MLDWLACRFAPKLPLLTEATAPELAEPAPHETLEERAADTFAELARVPFQGLGLTDPYKVLMGMGCRDLVTREADQDPETAGRTPNYDAHPAFQPLEIPLDDGPTLTGHHSTGAPGAPIVMVIHGLFDSHVTYYVLEYAEVLRRWGFHVVALDLRGHGRMLAQPFPPSLGLAEGRDLLAAARSLARGTGVSVGLLGLSYGAHCVVRAAHEASLAGEADLLRGGVMAVCGPLNVHEAVLAFDDPSRLPAPRGLLEKVMLHELLGLMRRHLRLRSPHEALARSEVYQDFIRKVVLPAYPHEPTLLGAYLGKARCSQPSVMTQLKLPVALVHPVDDPFVPVSHSRQAHAEAGGNPFVHLKELPVGGHVGLAAVDPAGTLALLSTFFGRLRDG